MLLCIAVNFQVLFLLYVIWMSVIIMNVLVGLTVSKIEQLVVRGGIIQAEMRIEDIVSMKKLHTSSIVATIAKYVPDWVKPQLLMPKMSKQSSKVRKKILTNFSKR